MTILRIAQAAAVAWLGVASVGLDGFTTAVAGNAEAHGRSATARASILRIYVSPDGNDAWRGDRSEPSADRRSGPVASLEAAREIARAHLGPREIVLRGGDYYLRTTVQFDARDSGLRIVAAAGEKPVLHGGPLLPHWRHDGGGRWSAPLDISPETTVGDLFVVGERQTEARFPDAGPQDDARSGWLFAARPAAEAESLGNRQFRFHAGDLPPLAGIDGLVAHVVGGAVPGMQWGSDVLPIVSIDRNSLTIHTVGTGYFFTGEGSRYFLAGREEFLDAPGEWWFHRKAGRLSYLPREAGFEQAPVVAGIVASLLRLDGASDVTIAGLGFEDGAPDGTGKVGTDTRGGGAVRLERAHRVRLIRNVFRNVGVAIHVSESDDVVITGNRIAHTAGNAIYLGTSWGTFRRSDRARISNNRIFDVGSVYFESAAIWFQAADDIRIAHNLIERTAQFGIAGGSIWGPDDACHRSVIEYNVIRDANRSTADGGAIKLMGAQGDRQESTIRYNVVTGSDQLMNRADGTFWPRRYENTEEWPSPISWAIYLDGRASGVAITGNLLRGNVAGIGINGGWSNVVAGNIVVEGSGSAFRFDDGTGRGWRPAWAASNRVEHNVVIVEPGADRVVDVHVPDLGLSFVTFTDNLYWGAVGSTGFRVVPAPWGASGIGDLARFSVGGPAGKERIADPGLRHLGGGYALPDDTAAGRMGIDLEPLRNAGPQDGCACPRSQ